MFWQGPPMGIYYSLDSFKAERGKSIGDPGTRPWVQGYPLVEDLPEGPPLPKSVTLRDDERKYPPRWGHDALREGLAQYYRDLHGAKIGPENVAVLGGGRQAIFSLLLLHANEMQRRGTPSQIVIEETEYTPYWDVCHFLGLPMTLVPSNPGNDFRPTPADHAALSNGGPRFLIKSNPCNPTGVTWQPDEFAPILSALGPDTFAMVDEAYEFFVDPDFRSVLAAIDDIESTPIAVIGAATKGLQFPGARIGWIVGSTALIEAIGNFVTFAVGGVSRPSQKFVEMLVDPSRVAEHRRSMASFNRRQSEKYGAALESVGAKLHTGPGGFYHWCEAPEGMNARDFDAKLRTHDATILPGILCDGARPAIDSPAWDDYVSPLERFFRFSFGPCRAEDADTDAELIRRCFA